MKKIDIKLGQNINDFLKKIKPKSSKNYSKKKIWIMWDIILGLIKGQSCFLNTIVQWMKHYQKSYDWVKKWKKGKGLSKISQIDKISEYLKEDVNNFKKKYLKNIFSQISVKSFENLKRESIKQRVEEQALLLHDTTDIQKPYARKMEKIAKTRDGSKHKSWRWYYAEWAILFIKWKIIPLLLTLFSWEETSDAKIISRKNIDYIKEIVCIKNIINVLDRWYDGAKYIKEMLEKKESFIIRWIKNKWVISPKYYNEIKWKCETQMERKNIFSSVKDFTKEMKFEKLESHKHYEIGYEKVLRKWEKADSDIEDVIGVNLVVIRLSKESWVEWIEEDIQSYKDEKEEFDKEFYFYTNLNIETIEDGLVIFYLYLKRRKIETWFKYLKQVFNLEKIKVLWYEKIKNMCNLLVFASYYLYDKYYRVLKKYESLSEKSLEKIIKEEEKIKKTQEEKLYIFLLKYYYQYCQQKNLKFTVDSFSRFINKEVWNEIIYCEKVFTDSW